MGEPVRDSTGAVIEAGAQVRILGVPELKGLSRSQRAETRAVFQHVVGRYKRVAEVTSGGWLVLQFVIRSGSARGRHIVELEPQLVRVRRLKNGHREDSL